MARRYSLSENKLGMRPTRQFVCVLLIGLLVTCSEDEAAKSYVIRGSIVYKRQPLQGTSIVIDNKLNLRAISDGEGNFAIAGVSAGIHTIEITNDASGDGVAEYALSKEVMVQTDVSLPSFSISEESNLQIIETDLSSIKLAWQPADFESGFLKYELYRALDDELDTDKILVYSSGILNDTTFVDGKLAPDTDYFYALVIRYKSGGTLTGGWVQSSTSEIHAILEEGQYFINHGFEQISKGNIPSYWKVGYVNPDEAIITSDESTSYDGQMSLKITVLKSEDWCMNLSLNQYLQPGIPAGDYEFSFYYKTDFTFSNPETYLTFSPAESLNEFPVLNFDSAKGWQRFSTPVTFSSNPNFFMIRFCGQREGSLWIDNLQLNEN